MAFPVAEVVIVGECDVRAIRWVGEIELAERLQLSTGHFRCVRERVIMEKVHFR